MGERGRGRGRVAGLAFVAASTVGLASGRAADLPYQEEACLDCHADADLTVTLGNGHERSLFIDEKDYAGSIHAPKVRCVDCHPDEEEAPHPDKSFKTERDLTIAYYEKCKRCHFANYSKTLDSVHYDVLAKGNPDAALCVDCHGSHAIQRPGDPRSTISHTCARCHQAIYDTYAKSEHGKALLNNENEDVPVCTDCHRAHDIADPRGQDWRLATPELCGACHTNQKLMAKYGLSANVVATYLADFHGATGALQKGNKQVQQVAAVCTDCHGVHDITTMKGQNAAVMRTKLLVVCRRCHPDAAESFPDAWLSHYEPSWSRAPLVYVVKIFYMIFIPFTIGGLILQIALHVWRVVVNR